MQLNLALNPLAALRAMVQPSSEKVAQQAVLAGASNVRDKLVRETHQKKSMQLVTGRVTQRNVLDKAGVTKISAAKKR